VEWEIILFSNKFPNDGGKGTQEAYFPEDAQQKWLVSKLLYSCSKYFQS
jgi:hypothetical protein